MKLRHSLAALLVITSLFGCATSSKQSVFVNLDATRQNVGQIGNVTLSDWDKQTGLSFFISLWINFLSFLGPPPIIQPARQIKCRRAFCCT